MDKNKIFQEEEEEELDIKELVFRYLAYWKWILLSIIAALFLGFFYLKVTPNKYESSARILLNNPNDNNMTSIPALKEIASITDLSDSNIEDQIEIIKSRRLMTKVVDKLDLNIRYYEKSGITNYEVYAESAGSYIKFIDEKSKYLIDTLLTLTIKIESNDRFILKDLKKNTKNTYQFAKPIKFYFGEIIVFKNPAAKVGRETEIHISPIMNTANSYIKSINIAPTSKNGNVVKLSLTSPLPETANKIIDLLVSQYREDVLDDRNRVGYNTISFINDRLDLISKDLTNVDSSMQNFKSIEKITDVSTESKMAVEQTSKISDQIKEYSIQLSLIGYMESFIKTNNKSLIPANIGLQDATINQTAESYNQLVLERDKLLQSSTEENPMVMNLNARIREVNNNLLTSLRNYKRTTEIALKNLEREHNKAIGEISQIPSKERGFKDIARKQQTVEALYLLLLQKREETEIAAASVPNIIKIVDKSYYLPKPVSPKKSIILFASLLLGSFIPMTILYLKFLLDNKIKSRKDIEKVLKRAPIVGEIPKAKSALILDSKSDSSPEAFRILRTNIDFILAKKQSTCIYITSTISGEGKTFISSNISLTFALTGKKVLLIEADIRRPQVRERLGIKGKPAGITEYLSHNIEDISKCVIHSKEYNIDIFPSGTLAPNPAELLMNGRFENIINYGKENYDYVIVDTAPIGIVTDTMLISKYADLTLYTIRANYLEKKMLDIPKRIWNEHKLNNIYFLINGIYLKGYNYGYAYNNYEKKPWHKKIFKSR